MNPWLKVVLTGLIAGVLGAVVYAGLAAMGFAHGFGRVLAFGLASGGSGPVVAMMFKARRSRA